MSDFIQIKHIKNDKRKKQVKDTAKIISKGAGMIFSTIGKGVKKLAEDIKESQKPENQLKRLKTKKELLKAKADVMKEQEKINKLQPKVNSGIGGLGDMVSNANKNIEEVFGTNNIFGSNIFNNKKNNKGGLI